MTQTVDRCKNGACTRPIYRGRVCYRCWAGIKWTSICQRVANKNGNNPSYEGLPIGFTREGLIKWVMDNPPPADMQQPSIDRIKPELGYSPGNIRWLEKRRNIPGPNRDLPEGQRKCSRCGAVKPATNEYFPRTVKEGRKALSTFCHPCNRVYQNNWRQRDSRAAS